MSFTVGGLFSGVGGIELGFKQCGYEILWANEFDKHASRTYEANFSHRLLTDNICELKGRELQKIDVLVAGFPCQPFTVAGYRKGFEDRRGNLFFHIIRLIKEMKHIPKVLLLENVKNFKTHDKGETFKKVSDSLKHNGLEYSLFPHVLNTSEYTVIPQNRERFFMVCFRGERDWFATTALTASWKFDQLSPLKKQNKPMILETTWRKSLLMKNTITGKINTTTMN